MTTVSLKAWEAKYLLILGWLRNDGPSFCNRVPEDSVLSDLDGDFESDIGL